MEGKIFMKKQKENISKLKKVALTYLLENSKKYILITSIFLIGIFGGVILVNNSSEETNSQISNYINSFINNVKTEKDISSQELMVVTIKKNIILAVFLWFAGTTVIGLPAVLILIFIRGLSLGYTISVITFTLGTARGIWFSIISLAIQNIFFIPAILTIGVSSIKLCKSILKDRKKENMKFEMLKHTIVSGAMMIVLLIAAFIENSISLNILHKMIKYF